MCSSDLAAGHRPDVAIVDIAIPHDNGIDITRSLRQVSPSTRVLVLSMHSNAEYVHQALLAGALGYVAKESAGEVLVKAVRAVNAGERFLCSESEAQLASPLAHRAAPATLLSAREHEVLRYTVEGLTIAETAIRLGISPKSVETYRSRLMTKLGIDGLPALVKFAIRNGITDLE